MTKTKRVVAIVLAFLMMFSSVSALASAFDPAVDGGKTLTVKTEILKNKSGTWTAVDKVKRGDNVKVRVSLGTDYYSNAAELIFFYDKTFFTDSYASGSNALSVNNSNFSNSYLYSSAYTAVKKGLISKGIMTEKYANTYNFLYVFLQPEQGATNFKYDAGSWLFEFDLTVLNDTTGNGTFFMNEATVQSTAYQSGVVNVPKGPEGGTIVDCYSMWLWDATLAGEYSDQVTVDSSISLIPNGGTWTATGSKKIYNEDGFAGEAFTMPAITREGYTLVGWYPEGIEDPTASDCTVGAEGISAFGEYEDITLYALWLQNVDVSFDLNYVGGSVTAPTTVVPGAAFDTNLVPKVPDRAGYEFRGWSADPEASAQAENKLPDVYPTADTVYYAVWAKKVTMTFTDSITGLIDTVEGCAGDTIPAGKVPAVPSHTGYTLEGGDFNPASPTVFPAEDTAYVAQFYANTYNVNYVIYDVKDEGTTVLYTASEPCDFGAVMKQDGIYTADEGEILHTWYTDETFETPVAAGATLDAEEKTLYGYIEHIKYTVTFDAGEGGSFDGEQTATTQAILWGQISEPEKEPTRTGYDFDGWLPEVGILSSADNNTKFTAQWTLKTFDITYIAWDEDAQAVVEWDSYSDWEYGDDYPVPLDPEKKGYDFKGWAKSEDGEVVTLPETVEQGDTYYAVFAPASYDITFYANEGTFASGTCTTVATTYLTAINIPAVPPTRTGYEFLGWSESATATEATADLGTLTTVVDEENPKEYYAVWGKVITLTFKDTFTGETIGTITGLAGSDVDASKIPEIPEHDGYYNSSYGYSPAVPAVFPLEDATYELFYEGIAFDVTYIVFDGNGADKKQIELFTVYKSYGDPLSEKLEPLYVLPEGKDGFGWYTDEACTQLLGANQTLTATTAPTYYGYIADHKYTVTFDANGGLFPGSTTENPIKTKEQKLVLFDEITFPATSELPTREGYTFEGWDTNMEMLSTASDVTIKADWSPLTFTIEYYVYDKDAEDYVLYESYPDSEYDDLLPIPDDPCEGYTFLGWKASPDKDAPVVSAEDMKYVRGEAKYYAKTTYNTYDVTFDAGDGSFADEEKTKTIQVEFGEAINPPATPTLSGYDFLGWSTNPNAESGSLTLGNLETMPDEEFPLVYYAIFNTSKVDVNFYVPERQTDGTLTASTNDYVKLDAQSYSGSIGSNIAEPSTDGTAIQYYKFLGWSTDGTKDNMVTFPQTVPALGADYYAVYEREAVYLVVKTEGTASIDRRGNEAGTWSTKFTTDNFKLDNYKSATSYSLWFVHVTPKFRVSTSSNPYTNKFFAVNGDGTITVTKGAGGYGTGTLITVTDNVTGKVVEMFYVVIYGDVNGDTNVNAQDVSALKLAYEEKADWSKKGTYDHAKIMAANLSGPTRLSINSADYGLIKDIYGETKVVDPLTGVVSSVKS